MSQPQTEVLIQAQAHDVVVLAKSRGLTVASAESLTAGLVSARIADVPGASAVLQGGVVSYSNEVKAAVLGVSAELLKRVGSVDAEVASAMAEGARRTCLADFGVSTTGVAGPDPHDGKEVGTVFIAVAGPSGVKAWELHLEGDRQQIREQSVLEALRKLSGAIREH